MIILFMPWPTVLKIFYKKLLNYLVLALVFVLVLDFVVCFLDLPAFFETGFLVVFLTILRLTLGFLELIVLRLAVIGFLVVFFVRIYMLP